MSAIATLAPPSRRAPQRIAVLGIGTVGLSTALLLSRRHPVVLHDADAERAHWVNAGCSPLDEPGVAACLQHPAKTLRATACIEDAVEDADCVIVTTPTRYDGLFRSVDTAELDSCLEAVLCCNPGAWVVLSSNLPVGYTERWCVGRVDSPPIVAPVVLRPGHALHDRLHPERMVIGERSMRAAAFAWMVRDCLPGPPPPILFTHPTEAEAIYLFEQKRLLQAGALSWAEVARYAARHRLDLAQLLQALALDGLPELSTLPEVLGIVGQHRGTSVQPAGAPTSNARHG